jgi:hypothetical protein
MDASTRARAALSRPTAALLLFVALGASCGGRSTSTGESEGDPEPLGPVHEGWGEYSLNIETVASDCDPPLASGDLGRVSVYVRTSADQAGASIAYFGMWPEFDPVHFDVDLRNPRAWEQEVVVSPPCGGLFVRYEIAPLRADSERIDIEWIWGIRGVETCPGELASAKHDCVSHQIFRYRFIRPCEAEAPDFSCQ